MMDNKVISISIAFLRLTLRYDPKIRSPAYWNKTKQRSHISRSKSNYRKTGGPDTPSKFHATFIIRQLTQSMHSNFGKCSVSSEERAGGIYDISTN
ncbi:hypothetical protein KM043_018582 [Ampulex compressa]|nr:hypothetical protein KM043_018582 [Ampulex compressa]